MKRGNKMDDLNFTDKDFEEMKSNSFAQAWVRKIDAEHCAVTLGDYDIDSSEVQSRCNAMKATMKVLSFFGASAWNVLNENMMVQILFCITYRVAFFFQK
jgi:hypothetical protein